MCGNAPAFPYIGHNINAFRVGRLPESRQAFRTVLYSLPGIRINGLRFDFAQRPEPVEGQPSVPP